MCVSGGQKTEQQLILPQEKKQKKPKTLQHFIFYISITSLPRNTQYTCYTPFE